MSSLLERLTKVVSKEHIDHHCSDLYVKVSEDATEIIRKYFEELGISDFTPNTFYDQTTDEGIEGKDNLWYDIPFHWYE